MGNNSTQIDKFISTVNSARTVPAKSALPLRDLLQGFVGSLPKQFTFKTVLFKWANQVSEQERSRLVKEVSMFKQASSAAEVVEPNQNKSRKVELRIGPAEENEQSLKALRQQMRQLKYAAAFQMIREILTNPLSTFSTLMKRFSEAFFDHYSERQEPWQSVKGQMQQDIQILKQFQLKILRRLFQKQLKRLLEASQRGLELKLNELIQESVGVIYKQVEVVYYIKFQNHFDFQAISRIQLDQLKLELKKQLLIPYFRTQKAFLDLGTESDFQGKLKLLLDIKQAIIQDVQEVAETSVQLCTDDFISVMCIVLISVPSQLKQISGQLQCLKIIGGESLTNMRGYVSWIWTALQSALEYIQNL